MTIPYGEWSLADIWQTIYTEPKLLTRHSDRRFRTSPYCLPLEDGAALSFVGDPLNQIVEATLWFKGDGQAVASVSDHGPVWYHMSLTDPALVNRLCFPYSFNIRDGFWCIVNHRNEDVRVFRSGTLFSKLDTPDKSFMDMVGEVTKTIDGYVDSIDVSNIPNYTLCDSCLQGSGRHLLQHIVRGEADCYMLRTLCNYNPENEFTDKQRELLRYVLKFLVAEPWLEHSVKFAVPPGMMTWIRRLPWQNEEYLASLKKLDDPGD